MRKVSNIIGGIIVVLLAAGVAGAAPNGPEASPGIVPAAATSAVSSGISYQGQLNSANGTPLNGTYTMRFIVYNDAVAGIAFWDSGNVDIIVNSGLFNTRLDVDQANFDGQALWLSIVIEGETLSPRQEILPSPYALSLRPGATIASDSLTATQAILTGYAPATGTALRADANGGAGIYGNSEQNYGVWGMSENSWGGLFTSNNGYGVRVDTAGTDHYDYGAYVTSIGGYGVYGQSTNNQGVRGEAGDISGATSALGRVGVVGMGETRGIHGASVSGLGIYGASTDNTGVYGDTGRSDRNYGLYTNDNLFSGNINLTGAIMHVMQNNGRAPLAPGDVVVFSGVMDAKTAIDGPIVQVSSTREANSTAVAGVVFSRFNIDALNLIQESLEPAESENIAPIEVTPAGNADPGEYILVVVQGPTQVKVDSFGDTNIQPGDLLSTGNNAGTATKATTLMMQGVETTIPGTVFAKALEPYERTQAMIYVYVTLQ